MVNNSEKQALLRIVKDYLNNTSSNLDSFSVEELYRVSDTLKVSDIVAYIFNLNNKHYDLFDKRLLLSISSYEHNKYYRNEITNLLEKYNYDFVFVKGNTLSSLYKEPYLRFSNDIDVVVRKENYEDIRRLLIEEFKLKCISTSIQESVLINNGVCIDLHRTFVYDNDCCENMFINSFNTDHEMDNNHKYMYLLAHGSKHMLLGVLDYCFFIDLYYLRQLVDKDVINELCKDSSLEKFNSAVNSYLDVLIGNKEYEQIDIQIEEFIFSSVDDKGASNRVLINKRNKNSLQYLIRRGFPKYRIMCYEYPILYKYKVLLPVYYVKRIITKLKGNRSNFAVNEIKSNILVDKQSIILMGQFINDLGLERIGDYD